MVDSGLSGRDVLVFGATGALGAAVAAGFAAAGAAVSGLDRAEPPAERQHPQVRYQAVDALSDAELAALFDGPPPWAVINTIGGYAPASPLSEFDPAELSRQVELNLISAALITKHALRLMQPAGQGRIVHTASRAATVTAGQGFAYSVSKLGVLHLVQMAADEVRGTGVTVNCVVPTIIDTPANRAAMPRASYDTWPKPDQIARCYLYLAGPDAALVNGAALPV